MEIKRAERINQCVGWLSLAMGGAIYLLWRPPTLKLFAWLDAMGLGTWVRIVQHDLGPYGDSLPAWTVFSLPNALWVIGIWSLIQGYLAETGALRQHLGLLFGGSALGLEVGQLLGIVPGTFDRLDLLAIASGIGVVWLWTVFLRGNGALESKDVD